MTISENFTIINVAMQPNSIGMVAMLWIKIVKVKIR